MRSSGRRGYLELFGTFSRVEILPCLGKFRAFFVNSLEGHELLSVLDHQTRNPRRQFFIRKLPVHQCDRNNVS